MTKRSEMSGARVVAEALRADEPTLDELTRARLEKRIVDAALGGASRRPGNGLSTRMLVVGAGVVALAAAALIVVLRGGTSPETAPGTATFEAIGGDQPVRSGEFHEGGAIETRAGQRELVRFAQSRIEVAPETRARFERLRANDVRVALDVGRVDVAFHPRHRGEEHLTIDTPSARVEVIGTEFTVELDAAGSTTVRVSEGVVRVVPRDGRPAQHIRAGGRTQIVAMTHLAAADVPRADAPVVAGTEGSPSTQLAVAPLHAPAAQGTDAQPTVARAEEPAQAPPGVVGPSDAPSAEMRFASASRLYHRGQLDEASAALIPLTRDARAPAAVRRDASNLLGDIYKGRRRLGDAAEEFERACGLGSDESCYSLGGVSEGLHQSDRARDAYRTYLRRAPAGALALQARARLCRPLGIAEACYGSVITPYTP